MHSIVVVGDVRTHSLHSRVGRKDPASKDETVIVYGGAVLVQSVIQNMLINLDENVRPRIFGFADNQSDMVGGQFLSWDVKETALEGNEHTKPRLMNRAEISPERTQSPQLSDSFKRAVSDRDCDSTKAFPSQATDLPPGLFEPEDSLDDAACPDIVVIDDLGLTFRKLRVQGDTAGWAEPPRFGQPDGEAQHAYVLQQVLQRLQDSLLDDSAEALRRQTRLVPVILVSISGRLPQIHNTAPGSERDTNDESGFWGRLFQERCLRDRTVVLVDVEDLRSTAGMAISSETSWERTAQETIAEFRRHPAAQNLLQFAHVIVRYGVTGALLITRRGSGSWSYRLYFDPANDDRTWSHPETEGTVLGCAGVLISSIVLTLTELCRDWKGQPLGSELANSLDEALSKGLRAAQALVSEGYPDDSHLKLEQRFKKSLEIPPRAFDYRANLSHHLTHTLFPDDSPIQEASVKLCQFSRVDVPELPQRSWSIARQSLQTFIGKCAFEMVVHGIASAINRPVYTREVARVTLRDCLQYQIERLGNWVLNGIPEQKIEEELSSFTAKLPRALKEWFELNWQAIRYRRGPEKQNGGTELWNVAFLKTVNTVLAIARNGYQRKRLKDQSFLLDQLSELAKSNIDRLLPEIHELYWYDQAAMDAAYSPGLSPFNPLAAPLVKFGSKKTIYTAVDRREIEGLNRIRKLIVSHLDRVDHDKELSPDDRTSLPLCFAVFGPPGTGKSRAIKCILSHLSGHPIKTEILPTFNLAQFTGEDDLAKAFDAIVKASAKDKVPIAFFDEFDSSFENKALGWLKFFLSPMEDGYYRDRPVNNAILVFAGGTSPNFAEFSLANRPTTDPQYQDFIKAKGPDFVSRLYDHLDIVGVNPVDSDDDMHLIRRAIVVRDLLVEINGKAKPDMIDPDVLRAVLLVPKYYHGTRSLKKLLQMCARTSNQRIEKSSVPPMQQLNMYVDGKAFWDLIEDISSQMRY